MKYIALLRGINVGGNSVIKMADLKSAVEKCGFTNVSTFIASGNIIFESNETDIRSLAITIEECLETYFKINSNAVVITPAQLKKVVSMAPVSWKSGKDLRKYIAFVKEPKTARDIMSELKPREGVDFAMPGDGAVYMSTLLSGLTKSGFTKLVGTPAYKSITIRNFNTVQKLLQMVETG